MSKKQETEKEDRAARPAPAADEGQAAGPDGSGERNTARVGALASDTGQDPDPDTNTAANYPVRSDRTEDGGGDINGSDTDNASPDGTQSAGMDVNAAGSAGAEAEVAETPVCHRVAGLQSGTDIDSSAAQTGRQDEPRDGADTQPAQSLPRPRESALSDGGGQRFSRDISRLSRSEILDIMRRAQLGEKITL